MVGLGNPWDQLRCIGVGWMPWQKGKCGGEGGMFGCWAVQAVCGLGQGAGPLTQGYETCRGRPGVRKVCSSQGPRAFLPPRSPLVSPCLGWAAGT